MYICYVRDMYNIKLYCIIVNFVLHSTVLNMSYNHTISSLRIVHSVVHLCKLNVLIFPAVGQAELPHIIIIAFLVHKNMERLKRKGFRLFTFFLHIVIYFTVMCEMANKQTKCQSSFMYEYFSCLEILYSSLVLYGNLVQRSAHF